MIGGTPVTDDFWANASNGTWSTGSNWVDGSTPTDANTANFDESGSYIVTFNATPDSIRELNVSDGTVSFNSSGGAKTLQVNSASGSQEVVVDGGATLNLGTSGNPLHLTIGDELSVTGGATLNVNYGSQLNADGDFDGMITEDDYAFWRANFGAMAPPPGSGSAATAAVPEPATWSLLIFGCIAIFGRYRRNFLPPRSSSSYNRRHISRLFWLGRISSVVNRTVRLSLPS